MSTQKSSQVILLVMSVLVVVSAWVEKADADFIFGTPVNLGPSVNSSSDDLGAEISADGLELYFSSNRPGGFGDWDLYVAERATIQDDWGTAMNLGSPPNSQYGEWEPSISTDGLTLYFSDVYPAYGSWRPDGLGHGDIWVSTRPTTNDTWGATANLGPVINSLQAYWPDISADGLSLYMISHSGHRGGSGLCDIFVARRQTMSESFGEPLNLGPNVNSSAGELSPAISSDELALFFYRGVTGTGDMWMATRKNISDPFGPAIKLSAPVNSSYIDASPHLTIDGSILYFCSNRPGGYGGYDLWQASIQPIVDFNGDGIVNVTDVVILTEHWGENNSLCDIGPMPWGDGIVDEKDLIVLAKNIEPTDRTLIAHWALDETEGMFAVDSAGNNNAVIVGGTEWQPNGGQVDGALQLNGVDGCAITNQVLNPVDGPFSVFAWIKGGTPGKVVISQLNGANWVRADPDLGCLMTELIPPAVGRFYPLPLISECVITDGKWHRIGFVWDGANRALYVDDILVAEDSQANLQSSDSGLYIGTGKGMESGSYWSGLIDDVRIYNRAVRP